jgi:hypothetical protein
MTFTNCTEKPSAGQLEKQTVEIGGNFETKSQGLRTLTLISHKRTPYS